MADGLAALAGLCPAVVAGPAAPARPVGRLAGEPRRGGGAVGPAAGRDRPGVLRRDDADLARAGRPGGAGGDGRGDLPGQGPGESDPAVLDRPDRRRDRAGQAGGAAGAGARPDRLRRPGAGAGDAPRRRRPGDADRCDPGLPGLRRLRLHAGADAVGLGPEDARGAAGDLRLRHLLAAVGADLGGPGLDAALVGPAGLAAGLPGPAALQPRLPRARPAQCRWPAGAGADRAGGAGPVLRARAPDLGAAGRRGDLADPGGGHPAGRPGGGDAPGGPPGRGPPRPARPARPPAALAVARRQPGALARVASAAAVALVGRRLGPLRRALGRVQPLGDRRGARRRRAGRPRASAG